MERCHYLTRLPPFTSSPCDGLGLTNGKARNLFAGGLLSHAQRQPRDLPNDRKTLTFTRCDCLSVCLCLISLPLLVGSPAARRQIDSAGCKQRGLIGVVIICLLNPPSNQEMFSKGEPLRLPCEKGSFQKPKKAGGRGAGGLPPWPWHHVLSPVPETRPLLVTDALCSRGCAERLAQRWRT